MARKKFDGNVWLQKNESVKPGEDFPWYFEIKGLWVRLESFFAGRDKNDESIFKVTKIHQDQTGSFKEGDEITVSKDKFRFYK